MKDKVFIIDNIYFIIAIAILTLWLTFVTAKGALTNNTYTRKWWKRITNRGLIAGFILISLSIVLVMQEVNNRRIADNNNIDLQNEQNLRSQKITQGVSDGMAKATDKLFKSLSEAFKKQGLQYDSIKNQVIKLKDSVRITNNYGPTPLVTFSSLEIKDSVNFDKTYIVETVLTSLETTARNTNLKLDIFAVTSKHEILTIKRNIRVLYKGQDLAVGLPLTNEIPVPKDLSLYSVYIFRLKGSYYQNTKTESKIDNLYLLWPRQKLKMILNIPNQKQEDLVRLHIKKNNYD